MKRIVTAGSSILLVFASLWSGGAALAHDEVVSVSPESGSTVDAGVIDLSVTFNEEVLTADGTSGFEIVVTNPKGEKQEVGCLSPIGATLSARTIANEVGEYTVDWHSVSSDGHPAEGTYKFKVTAPASEEIPADAINNCPRLLIAPGPEDPSAIAYSAVDDVAANDNTPIEIGILVLVLVLVLGSAVWVTRKRKK